MDAKYLGIRYFAAARYGYFDESNAYENLTPEWSRVGRGIGSSVLWPGCCKYSRFVVASGSLNRASQSMETSDL